MSLSGPFQYVFIPADNALPLEERTADKKGGLSDDELIIAAKNYFYQQTGGPERAAALDTASDEEAKHLAAQIRSQATENTKLQAMSDSSIMKLIKSTQASPQCEIVAVTVPTAGNQYQSVSMYIGEQGQLLNERATQLLLACGHQAPIPEGKTIPGIYGDAFVGRCHDDEARDDWTRIDIHKEEMDLTSPWIIIAASQGGGGGHGKIAASLSGVMGQMQMQGGAPSSSSSSSSLGAMTPEIAQEELGYQWEQTKEEVEIKFKVTSGTKAKYCKVVFGLSTLKITVAGQTICNGKTGGNIVTDESTFTIQDEGKGRELCITLAKKDLGAIWAYAVQKKEDVLVI